MNNAAIVGRLTRDPELKYTQSGTAVTRITVAVDRGLSKEKKQAAQANNQATADFINCTAWGKTAELISNYFSKGNQIGIVGRIQTGSYEKNGQMIYTTDVVINSISFVESKNTNNDGNNKANNQSNNYSDGYDDNNYFDDSGYFPVDNSDVPF
ncbi:MAG: single-stranded DNA-binding protein [Peptoniphilus senegalensis]